MINIRRVLFVLLCAGAFATYLYIEWDFHKGYNERRQQEKVEHEFYLQYKDSIIKQK